MILRSPTPPPTAPDAGSGLPSSGRRPTSRAGRRWTAVLGFAVLLSSAGLFAAPSTALGWSADSFSSADEAELVTLTNQARVSNGLPALKVDSTLTSIARWRSKDMIVRDYFSHSIPNPPGGDVFDEMDRRGYCYSVAGENIGWNNYPDSTATQAIQSAFMASSGHRANILGKGWDHIGVGAYKGSDGKKMWTVLFADKCGSSPAPKPKPKPQPKPAKATPRPTPKPTPKPARATPKPTPTPSPTATPQQIPDLSSFGLGVVDGAGASGAPPPSVPPGDIGAPSTSLRVQDPPARQGLFDTIVGGVAGFFFGG
ncbi:MAG TPA: CAP domain-containing protein [Candidatus Binatia bacterium]|nr:CAP domain-containing protein [Candidatus Binatia bacterium]